MPNWKKVIVSGSDAVLNNATLSGNLNAIGNISSSATTTTLNLIATGSGTDKGNVTATGTGSFAHVIGTKIVGALTGDVVGDVTGDLTGQADTVATIAGLAPNTATTQATQGNITSVGTLTSITSTGASVLGNAVSDTHTFTGHITASGNISSSGTVQGLTGSFGRVEATRFIGDLTGEADTVATIAGLAPNTATTQATQGAITSLGTLTGLNVNGQITASGNIKTDGFMLADYYVANTATTASAGINQAQATLLNHEAGIQFVSTDDSAKGVILPGVAEVPIGTTYTIHNVSSGSFHVYPKSSDRIFPLPADNLPATVPSSGSISITAFSSDGWRGFIGTLIS